MEHDVELAVAEHPQIPHIPTDILEIRASLPSGATHSRELSRADVEERRRGTELAEQDGVPAAAARERKDAFPLERDVLERVVGDAV
jgi:hypothetical protein